MPILSRISLAAAAILMIEYSNFWVWLISHPSWSMASTFRGLLAGIALALILLWLGWRLHLHHQILLFGSVLGIGLSLAVTYWGKTAFVAAHGDNHLAGLFWFFGFQAVNMFLTAALILAWPERR